MTAVRGSFAECRGLGRRCMRRGAGREPVFTPSAVRSLMAEVGLLANDGLIMGGTGNPVPDQDYLSSVESLYLETRRRLHLRRSDDAGAVLSDRVLRRPARLGFW